MLEKLKKKWSNYVDEKLLIPDLYDKLMKLDKATLYDKVTTIMMLNHHGADNHHEYYTAQKVMKDRKLTAEELIDAKDAKRVVDELVN